jgi:hypothetical protein
MHSSRITVEDDPVPIVLIVATILRRSEREAKRSRLLARAKGTVVFRSSTDPQAATIRFQRERVHVERGADPGADMTIALDLATAGDAGAPKPRVTGALAHLPLALAVSKLLEPPLDPWPTEAERFWTYVASRPGAPRGLRVVALDDGGVAEFGEAPGPGCRRCSRVARSWARTCSTASSTASAACATWRSSPAGASTG